jgi:hypothetical protein
MTATQINAAIEEKEQSAIALTTFVALKKVGTYLKVDEAQKKWLVPNGIFGGKKNSKVYSFSDIADFELLEDGSSIPKSGLGRALVGGALLGGLGAVVGGGTGGKRSKSICESLKIKITLNSFDNPTTYINFISTSTKKTVLFIKQIIQWHKNVYLCYS